MLVRILSGRELNLDISGIRSAAFSRQGGVLALFSSIVLFVLNPWSMYVNLPTAHWIAFGIFYSGSYFYIYFSFLISSFFLAIAFGLNRILQILVLAVVAIFHSVFVDFIVCLEGVCRDLEFTDRIFISAMGLAIFVLSFILFFEALLGKYALDRAKDQAPSPQVSEADGEDSVELPMESAKLVGVEMAMARDHYVEIHIGGRVTLIRAKFSDFIRRMPEDSGVQVNRSIWVSNEMIDSVMERSAGKLTLELKDGKNLSVARSRVNAAKRWRARNHKSG